jgi:DNA replication and repair protein RecF
LQLSFNDKFNVIYGNNAQGKTNILEALFLCASARSHRTSKENELIRFGENNFYVKIEIEKKDGLNEIEFRNYDGKKEIKLNGVTLNKIGRLMGNLSVVLFAPEDIMMLKEGPAERRRFLDISISQTKTSYFYDLQQYKKSLTNRNALLKEIKQRPKARDTLFIWDKSIAEAGSRIILTRRDFIKRLETIIKPKHLYLTNENEDINIKYKSSFNIDKMEKVDEIQEMLLKKLSEKENEDILRSSTSVGPHRDDFEIFVNNISVKNFGSQGQQRTSILSLKLAEMQIIKELTGENPVLLLDDFASELDEKRQNLFLRSFEGIQVLITSTHKDILDDANDFETKYILVKDGACF